MNRVLVILSAVERIAMAVAAAFMFAVMVIVTADVLMRYAFNRPFAWAYDLISLYLMAGIFFLGLSQAYASGAHVSVDILEQSFPPAMNRLSACVTAIVGIVVFGLIAQVGFWRALESFEANDVIAGSIPWPTWPSIALMPLGAGLLTLRLAVHLVGHVASLVTGREVIPASIGGHGSEGEVFE